ncbi:MAG: NAD(P)-dependent oxidoreductase [Bacteroidales bacterium]|nr:NAD(P)-dependent oxidoreductase [Bacteroidales bacterium]
MNSKVIVFGGSGFLGQYLVNELGIRGYDVTIVDINPSQNLNDKKFICCDILDREKVLSFLSKENCDFIFNLAGFANLDNANNNPCQAINLNVIGNINIMDGALLSKCERFIYASSTYAMSNKGSFYGISKLASEKLIEEYNQRYNLAYTILRYGSIYSEIPFENNYIYSLVEKAITTKSIVHGGDGQEVREYIHASDAARLSVDVIESDKYVNQHIILTGNENMKRIELFQLIKEILNEDIEIILNNGEYKHHYRYTPYSFTPLSSKKLVANPHIDMGQGILECIRNVYKNNLKDE